MIGLLVGLISSSLWTRLRDAAHAQHWPGFVRLSHMRAAAGGVFGLSAAAGISLSISDHSHHTISYVVWYGLAGLMLVVIITTLIVEHEQMAEPSQAQAHGAIGLLPYKQAVVGPIHEKHLHEWLKALAYSVNQSQACSYQDDQVRRALHTHFPDISAPCERWNEAIARADAAPDAAREQIEARMREAFVPDGYDRDALTRVVARFLIARPRYQIKLKAVQYNSDDDGGASWHVYTADGYGTEIKLAEMADAPVENLQAQLLADETALRNLVEWVRDSDRIPEIHASRAALEALKPPLLDILATKQAVSPILAAGACPYCEAQQLQRAA
jgi:hypothetical protein